MCICKYEVESVITHLAAARCRSERSGRSHLIAQFALRTRDFLVRFWSTGGVWKEVSFHWNEIVSFNYK